MNPKQLDCLNSLSLLYVEDDSATREELAQILELWFARVYVAENGQAGLEAFEKHRPDIVLTDIQMPVLNGLSMSAQIRLMVPDQPVIVLSAYNDMEYLFRAIDIGINQYVTKPVSIERLFDKLADIAKTYQARRDQLRNQRLLEQYRHLVDASAIVSKMDTSGRITYVNDKFLELTGFQREELIGQDIRRIRHPDEPKDLSGSLWQGVLWGQRWAGIVKNQTRTGAMLVVESSLVPVFNEDNAVEEVVCLDVDITDIYLNYETTLDSLSRSQRSLTEQRHFLDEYKRALELGTSICVTDAHGRILGANQLFADLLGYPIKDLCERPLSSITLTDYERCFQEVLVRINGHCSQMINFRHGDGTERVFSVNFVPVRDLRGQVASVILAAQDVTESMRLTHEIMETQRELLLVMGEVVENRSQETGRHVKRVAEIAYLLALKYGFDEERAELLKTTAPMHDIGKVGIADAILHKPGKLDADEFELMKTHTELGRRILSSIDRPLVRMAAQIAHEHHETYDGSGYPRGIGGETISIEARIIAVADVLDALSHKRIYKPAWDDAATRNYLRAQSGRKFDPTLIDLVFAHWDAIQAIRERYHD
jgi:PAS domain S-box-containing protein